MRERGGLQTLEVPYMSTSITIVVRTHWTFLRKLGMKGAHNSAGTATIENLFSSYLAAEKIKGPHSQPLQDAGYASSAGSQGYNDGGGGPEEEAVNKPPKPGKGKKKVGQPPKGKRASAAKAKGPRKGAAKKGGGNRKGGKKT